MKKTLTYNLIRLISEYGINKKVFFTKEDDEYIPFTFEELLKKVLIILKFFESCSIKQGDKVAIISESRTEWVIVDFACMFSGVISVPIYTSVSDNQIKYILENSDSRICFVSNSFLCEKITRLKNEINSIEKIVAFNDFNSEESNLPYVSFYSNLINTANEYGRENLTGIFEIMCNKISDDDLVTIIYTSGTTGIPKGVMLSHKNIFSNVISCQKVLPITEKDRFLSYLPYSHIYERTAGYYLPLYCGAEIYFAQNIDTISVQMSEVKPTFIITVPRLLDKIYNRLMKSGDSIDNFIKRKMFFTAVNMAKEDISKNSLKWKIADFLVYKKIREKTGGEVRFFISGGGALNKSIGKFFENIGITVLEGYGMTETSPVISVNLPSKNKYGTVGKILDDVQVKLSYDGEILVKGELVMKGYYRDEKGTNDILKDGWLSTGDIGEIDEENYLKITDRKKSMFKTSGGKFIAPAQIEDMLSSLDYIENIIAIGNERMYVTALIIPAETEIKELAKKNKIKYSSYIDLLKDKSLHKIIQHDIDLKQKELAHYERIRNFTLLENPFTIESGELTPTLKVKRKFIEEKYSEVIEKMYLKI